MITLKRFYLHIVFVAIPDHILERFPELPLTAILEENSNIIADGFEKDSRDDDNLVPARQREVFHCCGFLLLKVYKPIIVIAFYCNKVFYF